MPVYGIIMEKESEYIIKHISKTLDEILLVLKSPKSKFFRAMEISGTFVNVLGAFIIIDIIHKWIKGG